MCFVAICTIRIWAAVVTAAAIAYPVSVAISTAVLTGVSVFIVIGIQDRRKLCHGFLCYVIPIQHMGILVLRICAEGIPNINAGCAGSVLSNRCRTGIFVQFRRDELLLIELCLQGLVFGIGRIDAQLKIDQRAGSINSKGCNQHLCYQANTFFLTLQRTSLPKK